jgi:phenylacetate-CoA ligase
MESGALGDLICTGLLNADMPLVRYRVGDCGRLGDPGSVCQCGRTLPWFGRVEGRTNDVLITRDGRRVSWLNPVFYGIPVRQGQIIQEALERIRIRFVPAPDFTREAGRLIIERVQQRMGNVEVILEPVDEVPRSANGKFRAVVCSIPEGQRASSSWRASAFREGVVG